jgi:hypothetical protein
VILAKYISVWQLSEGSVVISGLSPIFTNKYGFLGTLVSNVDVVEYETLTSLQQATKCFNINTGLWFKNYVYKRLQGTFGKTVSYLITVIMIALWHGYAPGYFISFLMQFAFVSVEERIFNIFSHVLKYEAFVVAARYFWCAIVLGYSTTVFDLMQIHKVLMFLYDSAFWHFSAGVFALGLFSVLMRQ